MFVGVQPARAEAHIAESFGEIFPPSQTGGDAAAPPPDLAAAQTIEKGHGRIETRRIAVSAEVIPHLAWPGAAQVARIERERRIGDKVSVEVAYLVTSLTKGQAGPERLLRLARAHWGIENQLHYVRDVSMDEDRCGVAPAPARSPRCAISSSISSGPAAYPCARPAKTSARTAPRSSPSSPDEFF